MNRPPPRASLLALAALLALGPAAAGAEGATESPVPDKPPALTFAIVYPIVHPFFEPVTEMAVAYGRSRGVRIIARGPESTDVRQQMQIMESLIAERVDGIALCATDPDALAPLADRAIAAGIPTIAFESDMPRSRRLCSGTTTTWPAGTRRIPARNWAVGPGSRTGCPPR
jgi:ribose transport system substrate-binding protein